MADLVVGLAKSVVEGALTKAHAAIEEEAKLRKSAQRDLVFITGEFEMMHSFLNVANPERVENKVVMTWVRQVRELAYDVEDCIEFVVHLDTKTMWWWRIVPSWCIAPPLAVLSLDEAVDQIEHLKARVEDVSRRNARYNLISDTGSKPVIVEHHQQLTPAGAIVGATTLNMLVEARGATKKQQGLGDLTKLITTKVDHSNGLQVISVWGAGGDHGMTSIIRKTFNHTEICQNFNYRAWVKLMHPFSPNDFIRGLMAQFYANFCEEKKTPTVGMHVLEKMQTDQAHLFKEFELLVTQKRYLVILEGLSNMVEWDAIRTFLPHTEKGSCIIVSAQQSEVASLCIGHAYQILELKKFSDDHSVCALFKASQPDGGKGKIPVTSKDDGGKGNKIPMVSEGKTPWPNEEDGASSSYDPKKEAADEELTKKNIEPLVGRDSRMNELSKYPAKARVNSPPVMSVWGIAGVGKSALVKNLFHRMHHNNQFDKHYWVDVSHPFNLRELYLNLLSDIHSEKEPIEECHCLLRNQRCLIVIDEVRSTQEWDLLQAALVSKSSKSVIIIITTEASIASYCTNSEGLVFNVKALESASASDLFKKQVLEKNALSPLQVQDAEVKKLILKCGGIPQVIAAIAGSLARKTDKKMDIVRSLNDKFMHHLETDPEYDSLQGLFGWIQNYFRTCPDSLKPCIFYLSIFPRDKILRRRRLIRRWIAEGYSRDSHNESAEKNGEKHFSELLQLSILQQLSSQSSSITSPAFPVSTVRMPLCQVNGFIREYIVSRQMEENLVFELGDNCVLTTQRTGRHLVILENWDRDRIVFRNIDFSRLRSLTVFGEWESFFICESMKMIRVLDLEDASGISDGDLNNIVGWLRRLKFLSIRGHSQISQLPSSIGDLRQLQTLDIRNTSIVTLPANIANLQMLQYIRSGTNVPAAASACSWLPKFWGRGRLVGVKVPRGIGKLTALHTLGVVNVAASGGKSILKQLKKLTQVRKLRVSGINRHNSKEFGISDHSANLESLSLQLDNGNEGCLGEIPMPWVNLRSLKLYGLGSKLPESIKELTKLTKLDLEMGTLVENDIQLLAGLPQLCILRLGVKQSELSFYVKLYGMEDKSYEKVKILEIAGSSTSLIVTFGSKAMRNLELLKLDCSSGSTYTLPGLDNVPELKQIFLTGTDDEKLKADVQRQLTSHPKSPVVILED